MFTVETRTIVESFQDKMSEREQAAPATFHMKNSRGKQSGQAFSQNATCPRATCDSRLNALYQINCTATAHLPRVPAADSTAHALIFLPVDDRPLKTVLTI